MEAKSSYSPEEIEAATMEYHEGCTEGKITFLREAFGIVVKGEQTLTVSFTITVDAYDSDGDELDAYRVASAVESVVDANLADELGDVTFSTRSYSADGY